MKVKIDWPLVCKLSYGIDDELLQILERHLKGKGQNDHLVIRVSEIDSLINSIMEHTKNIRRCRTYDQKRP